MENEKTFRTKTGFCHILSDRIVLTRDGIIGNVSESIIGNNISKILIIYSIGSIFLFYNAYNDFQKGEIIMPLLFSFLGIYLIYGIIKSLNNSATPIIYKNQIDKIEFSNSVNGITRAYFEVIFKDKNSKTKKRFIMLPGSLSGGNDEIKKAIKIMTEEKLLSNSY